MLPPEIAALSQLTILYLQDNQLTVLPPEITSLPKLEKLYLHGNEALGIPPEIQGATRSEPANPAPPAEILDYYFRSIREISRPLLEAKVLVVGQGAVRVLASSFSLTEKKLCGTGLDGLRQAIVREIWALEHVYDPVPGDQGVRENLSAARS